MIRCVSVQDDDFLLFDGFCEPLVAVLQCTGVLGCASLAVGILRGRTLGPPLFLLRNPSNQLLRSYCVLKWFGCFGTMKPYSRKTISPAEILPYFSTSLAQLAWFNWQFFSNASPASLRKNGRKSCNI